MFKIRSMSCFMSLLAIFFFVLCTAFPAAAQGQEMSVVKKPFAENGMYFGLTMQNNSIGGAFNGEDMMIDMDNEQIVAVPKVEDASGYGIVWGIRQKNSAFELSYVKSKHDISWLGAPGEAEYELVSMDWKAFLFTDRRLQPFFLIGWVPYAWLTVKDGSAAVDYNGNAYTGDATYRAALLGFNLGGGMSIYLHRRIAVNTSAFYRWIDFNSLKGVSGSGGLGDESLSGKGMNYNVGMIFTF